MFAPPRRFFVVSVIAILFAGLAACSSDDGETPDVGYDDTGVGDVAIDDAGVDDTGVDDTDIELDVTDDVSDEPDVSEPDATDDADVAEPDADDDVGEPPACEGVDCGEGEICYRGDCYPECDDQQDCAPGDRCYSDHHCAPVDCDGVDCNDGETCYWGACYPDCESDEECTDSDAVCENDVCLVPSCDNGIQNDGQTDVDCGGPDCPPCAAEATCEVSDDCQSGVCDGEVCQAPTCDDGVLNGDETDVDCGGPDCDPCPVDDGCDVASDCISGVCEGGVCQAPTCEDGVQNADETGVDCGGPDCPACDAGQGCDDASDCISGVCEGNVCQAPSCTDGVLNGEQTDVDCGGPNCPPCDDGLACQDPSDCTSGVCEGDECQEATCNDGVQNGDETDVDCGGPDCEPCTAGSLCLVGSDCASGSCEAGQCDFTTPDTGQIIVTEFMVSPTEVSADDGQWIELYNRVHGLDLDGCTLETSQGTHQFSDSVEIPAETFVTIANSDQPGFEPDLVIDDLSLSDAPGSIELRCDGTTITGVDYGERTHPGDDGVSIARDADRYDELDDQSWLWCAGTGTYHGDDIGSPGEMTETCPWYDEDMASVISDIRASAPSLDGHALRNVLVTYVRPRVGTHDAGFFIQASPDGPAIFVADEDAEEVEDLPVRPGHLIDMEVFETDIVLTVRRISAFGELEILRTYIPPSLLTTDVNDADDILDDIPSYESRLVAAELTVESESRSAGDSHEAHDVLTDGMDGEVEEAEGDLEFRTPESVSDDLALEPGCVVAIEDLPMWRFQDNAQFSAWQNDEVEFVSDCPATAPVDVQTPDDTTVEVTFSRPLESVDADGSQFDIDGLDVTAASLDHDVVTLTTSAQSTAGDYTVQVSSPIFDQWGRQAQGEAPFIGYTDPPADAMDVVISEFMARFQSGPQDPGEYIEIHNPSSEPFNLNGCVLGKSQTSSYTIDVDIVVEPDQHALFTSSPGGAAELDEDDVFQFPNLRNSGDTIFLECDGTTIDELEYPGSIVELGISYQKDAESMLESNEGGLDEHWCLTPEEATYQYWTGDHEDEEAPKYGTPAGDNIICDN